MAAASLRPGTKTKPDPGYHDSGMSDRSSNLSAPGRNRQVTHEAVIISLRPETDVLVVESRMTAFYSVNGWVKIDR